MYSIADNQIDLVHRKVTISMNGPWANGDRMAFIRIHWSFPSTYPYTPDVPTFEVERNPTVSLITRQKIVLTIKEMRATNRQCLLATTAFLLGSHERIGRRVVDAESDSESDASPHVVNNAPMLMRTCGATFGPNGQLVCFFPKQTVLLRARNLSRSPSASRDTRSPFSKAMMALSRSELPRQRHVLRQRKSHIRRMETIPPQVQAGSTTTIHDVSHLGPQPNVAVAAAYTDCVQDNVSAALDLKRYGHANVWATLDSILEDVAPAYTLHPPPYERESVDARRDKEDWNQGMRRKHRLIDQMWARLGRSELMLSFAVLLAARDVQMLALVSVILLTQQVNVEFDGAATSIPESMPQEDYFAPPTISNTPTSRTASTLPATPVRKRSSIALPSPGPASYKTSGWSQLIGPGSLTATSAMTPAASSFDRSWPTNSPSGEMDVPAPLATSYEADRGVNIPGPSRRQRTFPVSPNTRLTPKDASNGSRKDSSGPDSQLAMSSSGARSSGLTGQRVSLGSVSPRRVFGRTNTTTSSASFFGKAEASSSKQCRVCSVKVEIPIDDA